MNPNSVDWSPIPGGVAKPDDNGTLCATHFGSITIHCYKLTDGSVVLDKKDLRRYFPDIDELEATQAA